MPTYMYNGVYVQMAQTLAFEVEPEYDPTNTDQLWTKYTIRVRGFVVQTASQFPGFNITKQSAVTLALVKNMLEAPRRRMAYVIGDTTLVSVTDNIFGLALDDKLGPHPLPARVTEVNTGTFLVECGCTVRLVECATTCPPGTARNPVISLRWGQTESFDENWYSRLKTKGRLIVRASLLQNADNFRPLVTPPLLPDYRRVSSSYTMSPDGLELEFEFDDKEEDRLPPFPATKAQGSYTVNVDRPGMIRHGTVQITLEGQKGADRKQLMNRAIAMAYSKLNADGFARFNKAGKASPPIWQGQFDEDLFQPKVRVSITAMMTPLASVGAAGIAGAAAGIAKLDGTPSVMPSVGKETDGLKSNQPGLSPPERKRLAGLLAAAFRDPCLCEATSTAELRTTGSPPRPTPATGIVNPTPAYPVTISIQQLTVDNGDYGGGGDYVTDEAPYDTYHIETSTRYDTGNVQLPATGVGPQKSVSAVVSAHGGMMQQVTTWVAGRTGAPPVLPTFISSQPNIVELSSVVVAQEVTPSPDGALPVYMLAGYYVHAVLDPTIYRITPAVPPMFGPPVQQAAEQAATAWNDTFWAMQAATPAGTNPFVPDGAQINPNPQVPNGFGGSALGAGTSSTSTTTTMGSTSGSGTSFQPPVQP